MATYGYNYISALHWLVSETVNGNAAVFGVGYDGDGNRVFKGVQNAAGTQSTVTFYLVDDVNPSGYAQVLEEYQGIWTNYVTRGWARPVALSRAYNYGSALISQQQFDPNTLLPSVLSYYGYDGHGSVRFLMDTGGGMTDSYTYDAFGNLLAQNGSTPNNYLYCGQQWDSDLGLYYNRARYLNTGIGRFWTMDGDYGNNEDPLSLHKYLYAEDEPVNGSDPSGNQDTMGELAVEDVGASMDGAPNPVPLGAADGTGSLPLKILPVHAYSLCNADSLHQFDLNYVNDHLKDANAILDQASIQLQLNPSDFHLWDMETTMKRAGDSMRVCLGDKNGAPGKNWATITQGQDRTVANFYFSGAFQNDKDQAFPGVLGMRAEKQAGNPCYPAVFLADPWGSVIAHEIGHLLGLDHVFDDENNLMYFGQAKPNPNAVLTKEQINQMRTSELLR